MIYLNDNFQNYTYDEKVFLLYSIIYINMFFFIFM